MIGLARQLEQLGLLEHVRPMSARNVEGVARAEDFLVPVGVLDAYLSPEYVAPVLDRASVVGKDLDQRVHVVTARAGFKCVVHVAQLGPDARVVAGLGGNRQIPLGCSHIRASLLVVRGGFTKTGASPPDK